MKRLSSSGVRHYSTGGKEFGRSTQFLLFSRGAVICFARFYPRAGEIRLSIHGLAWLIDVICLRRTGNQFEVDPTVLEPGLFNGP